MVHDDEAALVQAAKTRRQDFGDLYERYYPTVFAFVRRRVGDDGVAEDVAAQTFLRALQAIGRYEERGAPFASWLLRIAAHEIAERARRGGTVVYVEDMAAFAERADPTAPAPQEVAEQDERAAWLSGYLATLGEEQRRALRLRFWDDLAVLDVAARLGRGESATKLLLHRTLKALRERMRRDGVPAA